MTQFSKIETYKIIEKQTDYSKERAHSKRLWGWILGGKGFSLTQELRKENTIIMMNSQFVAHAEVTHEVPGFRQLQRAQNRCYKISKSVVATKY